MKRAELLAAHPFPCAWHAACECGLGLWGLGCGFRCGLACGLSVRLGDVVWRKGLACGLGVGLLACFLSLKAAHRQHLRRRS